MKWTRHRCQVACSTLAIAAFEPVMGIRDHQAYASQPTSCQGAQKLQPERLRLRRVTGRAKYLAAALGIHSHRYHQRTVDHVAILP